MSVVFDAEALLALYLGEPGADKVKELLECIQRGETTGYLNVINLTEFCYILQRQSNELAKEKKTNLRAYGVEIVSVFDDGL